MVLPGLFPKVGHLVISTQQMFSEGRHVLFLYSKQNEFSFFLVVVLKFELKALQLYRRVFYHFSHIPSPR
jgi:hypothetical protein